MGRGGVGRRGSEEGVGGGGRVAGSLHFVTMFI